MFLKPASITCDWKKEILIIQYGALAFVILYGFFIIFLLHAATWTSISLVADWSLLDAAISPDCLFALNAYHIYMWKTLFSSTSEFGF